MEAYCHFTDTIENVHKSSSFMHYKFSPNLISNSTEHLWKESINKFVDYKANFLSSAGISACVCSSENEFLQNVVFHPCNPAGSLIFVLIIQYQYLFNFYLELHLFRLLSLSDLDKLIAFGKPTICSLDSFSDELLVEQLDTWLIFLCLWARNHLCWKLLWWNLENVLLYWGGRKGGEWGIFQCPTTHFYFVALLYLPKNLECIVPFWIAAYRNTYGRFFKRFSRPQGKETASRCS